MRRRVIAPSFPWQHRLRPAVRRASLLPERPSRPTHFRLECESPGGPRPRSRVPWRLDGLRDGPQQRSPRAPHRGGPARSGSSARRRASLLEPARSRLNCREQHAFAHNSTLHVLIFALVRQALLRRIAMRSRRTMTATSGGCALYRRLTLGMVRGRPHARDTMVASAAATAAGLPAVVRCIAMWSALQRVETWVDCLAPVDGGIPVQHLLEHLSVRHQSATFADQPLQSAPGVGLARIRAPTRYIGTLESTRITLDPPGRSHSRSQRSCHRCPAQGTRG